MKLNYLLTNLFELNNSNSQKIDRLDHDHLLKIKEKLLECDEFKNVKNFEIIEIPDIENEIGKIVHSKSFALDGDVSFGNKCYIHSISISPEIFNPNTIYEPVKDGACITPIIYNPSSLEPKRKICIEFSVEQLQDNLANDGNRKDELVELFKKVLESPNEYMVKGERKFIIRGIFDEITINGETHKEDIGELNLDYNNQKHFKVFYFDKNINVDGSFSLILEQTYLPNSLKELFSDKFNDRKIIYREEVENFLKEYGN